MFPTTVFLCRFLSYRPLSGHTFLLLRERSWRAIRWPIFALSAIFIRYDDGPLYYLDTLKSARSIGSIAYTVGVGNRTKSRPATCRKRGKKISERARARDEGRKEERIKRLTCFQRESVERERQEGGTGPNDAARDAEQRARSAQRGALRRLKLRRRAGDSSSHGCIGRPRS